MNFQKLRIHHIAQCFVLIINQLLFKKVCLLLKILICMAVI